MIVGKVTPSISKQDIISKVQEKDLWGYYLGITSIPCVINSPLRQDSNPSFGIDILPNGDIYYKDFANGDKGDLITLLQKMYNLDTRVKVYNKIQKDLLEVNKSVNCQYVTHRGVSVQKHSDIELRCKIREWESDDLSYWGQYGITLNVLKAANVYPVSHKFIIKDGKSYCFRVTELCYAFLEFKEGKETMKLYCPFNKNGYKWQTSTDKSVISLWNTLPEKGDYICICSSLKDSLTLICNLGIPCINLQGEGYPISDTAIKELKRRFKYIFVLYDSDETGIKDAKELCDKHQLINIELPIFTILKDNKVVQGKDIAEYRESHTEEQFKTLFKYLFKQALEEENKLPF